MTDPDNITNCSQSTLDQGEDKLKAALCEAQKRLKEGREQIAKMAATVDKQAHENPWPWIASVGVGALLLGVIIGKSRK